MPESSGRRWGLTNDNVGASARLLTKRSSFGLRLRRAAVRVLTVAVLAALSATLARGTANSEAATVTKTFAAAADAYVSSSKPSTNYGKSSKLVLDGSPTLRGYVRFSVTGLTGSVFEYDVTPLVTGDGSYGFALTQTSSDGTDFYSREAANLRPELVITYE